MKKHGLLGFMCHVGVALASHKSLHRDFLTTSNPAVFMPILKQIHRFPVKGFSHDSLPAVQLQTGQALPFDRRWAIENGPGDFNDAAPVHVSKRNFLMLVGQPRLARLKTRYIDAEDLWEVRFPSGETIAIDPENSVNHLQILLPLSEMFGDLIRGPLRIVRAPGQALTDIAEPFPSIINLATVRDLGERIGADLDPVRFRGNLLIDDMEPGAELDLIGKRFVFENVVLRLDARIRRCAATSVNPDTAEIDQDLPRALFDQFGHMDCGVYAEVERGGELRAGTRFTIEDV